jgi:hypothetical protein
MKMGYLKNIELALSLGFEEVLDENAYNGRFYIKDDKIWIHDIEALKAKLHFKSDKELKDLNYDVDSYCKYVNYTNEMVDRKIEFIKASILNDDSVLSGRYDVLQDSETLNAMGKLAAEGFDEEILADFAHQMSKR